MPRKPYAGSSLAKFVTKRVLELRPKKSQVEIAAEAGYINSNVISMLKNGSSKLALDRVPALARALETDPALLFKLACEQEGGETLRRTVEEIFGLAITRNEIGWIQAIREASDHSDPSMTNRLRSAIFGLFPVVALLRSMNSGSIQQAGRACPGHSDALRGRVIAVQNVIYHV